MSGSVAVAAADLGASGGRVIVGRVGPGELSLHEAHRFPNQPVRAGGTLHWDILALYREVLAGLRAAGRGADLASVGIDGWGVDFGLLDADGVLLGNPVHYRDARTDGADARLAGRLPPGELYRVTGIQRLPINTIVQLTTLAGTAQLAAARTLLLIPDLLGYWLTGAAGAELTNASTTQMIDAATRRWAVRLVERAGLPAAILPPLRRPGDLVGGLRPDAAEAAGLLGGLPVTAVGSHDTASAVAGVPAGPGGFAYISCGTWSLVGLELPGPVLSAASRRANFSNEIGIDGTVRYLRNVMGLWLLQESARVWADAGLDADPVRLAAAAAAEPPLRSVIDPDDTAFLAPGDMPSRIAAMCAALDQPPPDSPAGVTRCILDSLALAYHRAVTDAQALSGRQADVIHLVGGGSRNDLLAQLTADACGLPVLAGPAEATAIGNVLVQARALGAAPADLPGLRALIRATQPVRRFEPSGPAAAWRSAARRLPAPAGQ